MPASEICERVGNSSRKVLMTNIYNRSKNDLGYYSYTLLSHAQYVLPWRSRVQAGHLFLAVGIGMGADSVDHESGFKISH
jgi:hypothetical protein